MDIGLLSVHIPEKETEAQTLGTVLADTLLAELTHLLQVTPKSCPTKGSCDSETLAAK